MFTDAAAGDRTVRQLVPRVRLFVDEEYDARFPARRGARVRVLLADGGERAVDVPDRSGSPESPLSAARLADKFVAAAAPVLGASAADVHAAVLALDLDLPVSSLPVGPK